MIGITPARTVVVVFAATSTVQVAPSLFSHSVQTAMQTGPAVFAAVSVTDVPASKAR